MKKVICFSAVTVLLISCNADKDNAKDAIKNMMESAGKKWMSKFYKVDRIEIMDFQKITTTEAMSLVISSEKVYLSQLEKSLKIDKELISMEPETSKESQDEYNDFQLHLKRAYDDSLLVLDVKKKIDSFEAIKSNDIYGHLVKVSISTSISSSKFSNTDTMVFIVDKEKKATAIKQSNLF